MKHHKLYLILFAICIIILASLMSCNDPKQRMVVRYLDTKRLDIQWVPSAYMIGDTITIMDIDVARPAVVYRNISAVN